MNNTTAISQTYTIGGDITVNRLGYGAMRLSGQPGNFGAYPNWEGGKQLLRRAVELGVNFIDTAEAYGAGFNEKLITSALHPYKQDLIIATKGGINKSAPDSISQASTRIPTEWCRRQFATAKAGTNRLISATSSRS